jgi:hypothetical protein
LSAQAQNITASDNASAANYPLGWTMGSNGGFGFLPWTLPGSPGTGGFNGGFLGNATSNGAAIAPNYASLYSGGVAFSIYAGGDAGAFQDALRPFSAAMSTGQVLSFSVGFSFDNGNKGFDLYSNSNGTGQVFNFNIGTSYSWTGGGSANMTSWVGVRENGVVVNFSFTKTASGFSYSINSSQDPGLTQSGNITAAGLGSLKFYISGAGGGDGGNLYFNNLQIAGDPAPPTTPTITSPASANGTVGNSFIYQTTATPAVATTYSANGLPDGLSMNSTTGLISGTPTASGSSSVTIVATNSAGSSGNFSLAVVIAPPAAPSITSPWSAVTVPGVPFSYQTTVSPSAVPTTFTATSLPSGLSINASTGLISGNVAASGYYSSNVSASNVSGTGNKTIYFYVGKAADSALNYSGNWTNGSNLSFGSGFGNWTFNSSNGSGAAGTFLGNPASAGIAELPTESFGLYANPGDSGAFVDARRELSAPLTAGEALAFDWGINFDSNTANGSKGFIVLVGTEEVVNVFNGNSGNITVNGVDSGFNYGTNAMFWEFTQTNNNTIAVYAEPRNLSDQVFTANITTNGTITAVKFYANGLDADIDKDKRQPYFNNLVIMPSSGPAPSAYDSWASGYTLNPSVTTGPTAGAPSADPDTDGFTNQQEYAFGTNPTTATPGLVTTSNSGGGLTVVFLTRSDLAYNVQSTENLSTIPFSNNTAVTNSVTNSPSQAGVPDGYTRRQFTITPSGSKNFYRVIATEQTPG